MDKVVILGSGSWGTGLAVSLANNKKPVTLWCRNPEQAAEMTAARENSKYLPKVHLAESIQIVTDMEEAVREADIVIHVCAFAKRAGNSRQDQTAFKK